MANLMGVVRGLRKQRDRAQAELTQLESALAALTSFDGRGGSQKRSRLSVAARKRISLAQKARWAKQRATDNPGVAKTRRTMSAASRRRIAAVQKARWAKWKEQHKT